MIFYDSFSGSFVHKTALSCRVPFRFLRACVSRISEKIEHCIRYYEYYVLVYITLTLYGQTFFFLQNLKLKLQRSILDFSLL